MVTGFQGDRDAEAKARDADHTARDEAAARQDGLSAQAIADLEAREQGEHDLYQLVQSKSVAIIQIAPDRDAAAQKLYQEGLDLRDLALRRQIKNDTDVKVATDDLAVIKTLVKKLQDLRVNYEAPFKEHLANFRSTFDAYLAPLIEAERLNKEKWGAYRRQVEEARARAEETNRMAEEVARRQAEASGTGEIKVDMTPVEAPTTADTIRSNISTGSAYKIKKWRLIDITKVPPEFLLVDAGKVTKLVKAGIGSIAGIEIYEEETLRVTIK
jgi:hypothetical protein